MIHETIHLYADRPEITLTTFVLDASPEMLNDHKRPAVLICPGGGYLACSDREAEPVALRFAAMGYHAFVLRYSTYFGRFRGELNQQNMPVKPEIVHPAPVRDIGRAFLTIRDRADEWGVDMNKVAICGFSAGGHNAAMYAVYWNQPLLTDYFGEEAAAFKPAAVLLAYALIDFHIILEDDPTGAKQQTWAPVAISFLGTTEPDSLVLDVVSPNRHVTAATPPMFLWSTVADPLVTIEHSLRMSQALAQAGVPFEAHFFEEGEHGISLADQSTSAHQGQIEPDAAQWMGLAEAWLHKRFALPIPAARAR